MSVTFSSIVEAVELDYIGDLKVVEHSKFNDCIYIITGFSDLIGAAEFAQKVLAKAEGKLQGVFQEIEVGISGGLVDSEVSLSLQLC